ADNTILVFLTDNGTAAGSGPRGGYNAGMRGTKGSAYEGGHRVPSFVRWPGKLPAGRDVARLTAHLDLPPTLLGLCGVTRPAGLALDGASLRPLLAGKGAFPERTLFVHSQRVDRPRKWKTCAVMTERWRLINGKELYDLRADPGQEQDVAGDHPRV